MKSSNRKSFDYFMEAKSDNIGDAYDEFDGRLRGRRPEV